MWSLSFRIHNQTRINFSSLQCVPHAQSISFFLLTLRNVLIINEEELLVSLPTINMENHPAGCSRLHIQYIHSNPLGPYLQAVSSTYVGGEPCCDDSDRLSNNNRFVRLELLY